ncbi:PREDICTED: uncharacterized protein LOC105961007 [Erythranthe guttata]|uniref:uncharacterized protein LOC105961007 n=1 Tax=Erythranthe guttata TaxID=4155 RepID=UPI00064D8580|nr:PREDICTED: uncharacterized protein LOC105961007 [Erythranthe guttata]|eukprot:XP_012840692.1 PREDICTED: uncharacterized protein LOC105961007 [Erythranthe guttata]
MAPKTKVTVMVYIGCHIKQDEWSVAYDRPPRTFFRVDRKTLFSQLLSKLYECTKVDKTQFYLRVFSKWVRLYVNRIKETLLEVKNDEELQMFLDPEENCDEMHVFIRRESINRNIANIPPTVRNEWGKYMSLLSQDNVANVGLGKIGAFNSKERFNLNSNFNTPNVGGVGFRDTCASSSTPVYVNPGNPMNESRKRISDSNLEIGEVANPIGDNNNVEEASSKRKVVAKRPLAAHNEKVILKEFFAKAYPEIPADSIDVPIGPWAKTYDRSTGVLEVGMMFNSKNGLVCAVEDYSTRFAKREYRVVDNAPNSWKVVCKHGTADRPCRWWVRGLVKAHKLHFTITRYGGDHTCVVPNVD